MPKDLFPGIKTFNLSRNFGQTKAVDNVNLTVEQGKIYALIGPNGAGKTTLIKMFVGLLSASGGRVEIFGKDIAKNPLDAKELFGYVPDDPSFYDYLTGREFLALTGKLRQIEEKKLKSRIQELVGLFPIEEILDQRMGSYSRGNKQKLAFLAALLSNPKLLIIDEPVIGLDPLSIKIFGQALKDFTKDGGTIFLVTHILSFAKDYADTIGLMDKGKLAEEDANQAGTDIEKIYQEAINSK